MSIESPRSGFLYVIDREQYADGSTSDPYLIFPTQKIHAGNNAVSPGKVIELERQWSTGVERFEMVNGAGKPYTKSEREAAEGAKTAEQS